MFLQQSAMSPSDFKLLYLSISLPPFSSSELRTSVFIDIEKKKKFKNKYLSYFDFYRLDGPWTLSNMLQDKFFWKRKVREMLFSCFKLAEAEVFLIKVKELQVKRVMQFPELISCTGLEKSFSQWRIVSLTCGGFAWLERWERDANHIFLGVAVFDRLNTFLSLSFVIGTVALGIGFFACAGTCLNKL